MSRIQLPASRRPHRSLPLLFAIFTISCGGGETLIPALTGGGGSSSELVFSVPQEGAEVYSPQTFSVDGDSVTNVQFQIDGETTHDDSEAPFEWTLEPESYAMGEHMLNVIAVTADGEESVSVSFTITEAPPPPPPPPPPPSGDDQPEDVFEAVKNLASGRWLEIPNTKLRDVTPDPAPIGNTGVKSITIAWSGAAFDSKRDRLVVWGGGHGDYAGNELYVFDLGDLKWTRLTNPSTFPDSDPWNHAQIRIHSDGRPVSRHTYDHLEYLPSPIDRFISGGGGSCFSNGYGDKITWLFDFDQNEWIKKSDCPEAGVSTVSGVDANGIYWQHRHGLASYDASQDKWTRHTQSDGFASGGKMAVVDHANHRFVVIGKGAAHYYDLNSPSSGAKTLNTTGATGIQSAGSLGLEYHPPSKRIIAWGDGSDVYALDVSTLVWTKIATTGTVTPSAAVSQGTYGRFRYSPTHDLFVLYNKIDDNVFVYRLPEK